MLIQRDLRFKKKSISVLKDVNLKMVNVNYPGRIVILDNIGMIGDM